MTAPKGNLVPRKPGVETLGLDRPEVRTFEFDLPVHRHRVMFADGGVIDILSRCTDSRLNDHALKIYYGDRKLEHGDRIAGFTDLGPEP